MPFEDLEVYKLSMRVATEVYKLTERFPKSEMFGLSSQLRRASVSVPCNISEGAARNSKKEFAHFIGVARGSCAELRTLLVLSESVCDAKPSRALCEEVDSIARMLTGLSKSLRSPTPGQK